MTTVVPSTTFVEEHISPFTGRSTRDGISTGRSSVLTVSSSMDSSFFQLRDARVKFPPAPRLVGIEPNPGPPKRGLGIKSEIVKGIAEAGAFLGAQAASAVQSRISPTKKKKKKTTESVSTPSSYRGAMVNISTGVRRQTRIGGPFSNSTFRIPFKTTNIQLQASAGALSLCLSNVGVSASVGSCDLTPAANAVASQGFLFGYALNNVSKAFDQWRFVGNIRVCYNPSVSTSTDGSFVLGYVRDPWVTGALSYADVSSCKDNMPASYWEPTEMVVSQTNQDWMYTYSTGATESSQRLCYAGSLLAFPIGNLTASKVYGTITLEGVLEFRGLADQADLQMRNQVKAQPTDAVSSHTIDRQSLQSLFDSWANSLPVGYIKVDEEKSSL